MNLRIDKKFIIKVNCPLNGMSVGHKNITSVSILPASPAFFELRVKSLPLPQNAKKVSFTRKFRPAGVERRNTEVHLHR